MLRQTTLPIVPTRHQTFQRQLSHRLEMPSTIQFSICSLEHKSETSLVGLIKVRVDNNETQNFPLVPPPPKTVQYLLHNYGKRVKNTESPEPESQITINSAACTLSPLCFITLTG